MKNSSFIYLFLILFLPLAKPNHKTLTLIMFWKDWKEWKKIFQIFRKAKLMNLKKIFHLATSQEMNQDLMKLKQKID